MSVSYEQIQKYAEAVGWKMRVDIGNPLRPIYRLSGDDAILDYTTLTEVRTRLAAKYRELAEQAKATYTIWRTLSGFPNDKGDVVFRDLSRIADSLSEPEEPTMLERLKKEREHLKREPGNRMGMVFDALIALYKAKE